MQATVSFNVSMAAASPAATSAQRQSGRVLWSAS
jgi:hypothetical protein